MRKILLVLSIRNIDTKVVLKPLFQKSLMLQMSEGLTADAYRVEVRTTHHDSDTLRTGIFLQKHKQSRNKPCKPYAKIVRRACEGLA